MNEKTEAILVQGDGQNYRENTNTDIRLEINRLKRNN